MPQPWSTIATLDDAKAMYRPPSSSFDLAMKRADRRRLFEVKHFQTIRHCNVDVALGARAYLRNRHQGASTALVLLMLEAVTTDLVSPSARSAALIIFRHPQAGSAYYPILSLIAAE